MNTYSPIMQLLFVILAGGVGFLFVKPMLQEIHIVQQDTAQYNTEIANVRAVNESLAQHMTKLNAVSLENKQAMERYVPTEIDPLFVMRDIEAIAAESGVAMTALDFAAPSEAPDTTNQTQSIVPAGASQTSFTLSISTTYSKLKDFLHALDINNYPLEVTSLEITPTDNGDVTAQISLAAFSLKKADELVVSNE